MKQGMFYVTLTVNGNSHMVLGTQELISGKSSLMNYLKLYGFTDPIHSHELVKEDTTIRIVGSYGRRSNKYVVTDMDYFSTMNKFSKHAEAWAQILDYYNGWATDLDSRGEATFHDISDIIELLSKEQA